MEDTLQFKMESLKVHHDCQELLERAVIFLGGIPPSSISFSYSHFIMLGWMEKATYCIQIFLFWNEFNLIKKEEIEFCEICVFLKRLYIKV